MKYIITTVLIITTIFLKGQGNDLKLEKTGSPDYRRLLKTQRAFPIYTREGHNYFQVLPRHIYRFGDIQDTLVFEIFIENQKISEVVLRTQGVQPNFTFEKENAILNIHSENNEMSFFLTRQLEKEDILITPLDSSIYEPNELLGYVKFRNRLVRYTQLLNTEINIAIMDKNKNGKTDFGDLLCVSKDSFFHSQLNRSNCQIKKENYISIYNRKFKIQFVKENVIHVQELKGNSNQSLDIEFSDTLKNILLDYDSGTSLKDAVAGEGVTIINVWSIYCPPCIGSLSEFNKLSDKVVGLSVDSKKAIAQLNVKFKNYTVTNADINSLNINGYPGYYVVNRKLEILGFFQSTENLLSFYSELENKRNLSH